MNNYPTVRTDDILIHPRDGDMIIGSHAGASGSMDDITPLQQLTPACRPRRSTCLISARRSPSSTQPAGWPADCGQKLWVGENAPRGTRISYYLKSAASGAAKITVTDAQGRTLCSTDGRARPASTGSTGTSARRCSAVAAAAGWWGWWRARWRGRSTEHEL